MQSLCSVLSHEGPDASIDNCSIINVLPRQVTLVWFPDQLQLVQNIAVTGYTLNCSSIGNIITTSATITSVNITTGIVPYTNYTCTLAAETTLGIIPLATCNFETPQDSEHSFLASKMFNLLYYSQFQVTLLRISR